MPVFRVLSHSSFRQIRLSSSKVVDQNAMLYSKAVSFVGGRNQESISLDAVYQDSNPSGDSRATVLALHGVSGSHSHFRHLLPLLQKKNIRMISVNYPGHGFTKNDNRLTSTNDERNNFVQAVADSLMLTGESEHPSSGPLILLGHSRAGENALQIAVNNESRVRGLIVLNSPGLRVHQGVRPIWRVRVLSNMSRLPALRPFVHNRYNKLMGIRESSEEVAVCSINSLATFTFDKCHLAKAVASNSSMSLVYAYSGDDVYVEKEHCDEFVQLFEGIQQLTCSTKDASEDASVTSSAVDLLKSDHRLVSVCFEKEGHGLPKFRANFIAEAVEAMVDSN